MLKALKDLWERTHWPRGRMQSVLLPAGGPCDLPALPPSAFTVSVTACPTESIQGATWVGEMELGVQSFFLCCSFSILGLTINPQWQGPSSTSSVPPCQYLWWAVKHSADSQSILCFPSVSEYPRLRGADKYHSFRSEKRLRRVILTQTPSDTQWASLNW